MPILQHGRIRERLAFRASGLAGQSAALDWCLPKQLQCFPRAGLVRRTWGSGWTITLRRSLESRFIHEQGSVAGMQLAHAGRKASTYAPWAGHGMIPENKGGWNNVVASSALAFTDGYPMPRELSIDGIQNIVFAFAAAARRACEEGFRLIEIHAAHGYLIHKFPSPISNQRTDAYGGSFENRIRILREIIAAVRGSWPERAPLFVRISATDWIDGGWDIEQSVELARQMKQLGVDLIDCSSGGNAALAKMPVGPGYQTPFAEQIRRETNILTGAWG